VSYHVAIHTKEKAQNVCYFEILYVFQNERNHSESNKAETNIKLLLQIWSNVGKCRSISLLL